MTANTFAALCAEAGIDPAIAMENDNLREALADRNDDEVKRILSLREALADRNDDEVKRILREKF